jgi:N-methylhydantoinase A/oxoprolinase/acetone carboxylase beta subunit
MPDSDLRLGIDVGSTNADAVLVDERGRLVAKAKVSRPGDVAESIAAGISAVCAAPGVDRTLIVRAMLGSAYLTARLLDRQGIEPVGVLRIGAPLTRAVPPLSTWPPELRRAASAGEAVVGGGAEYDGRMVAPLDVDAVARFAQRVAGRARGMAICGVFSPVSAEHELVAAEVVRRELGSAVGISLSHEIGGLGLLERENATVLNAALVRCVEYLEAGLEAALQANGIVAEPVFTQNDGTLMGVERARRFPVLMVGGGPANGMRGAAYLTGFDGAVVIDVGGSGTVIGALVDGFPREAVSAVVGGVRMQLRTPDVRWLPLGGGSIVHGDPLAPDIGPRSLGADLGREALAFGGATVTLADAVVAAGRMRIGTHAVDLAAYPELDGALGASADLLAEAVDRSAVPGTTPIVVAVGGAAAVVPDQLAGATTVVHPPDGDVASAIGAAIAPVSGRADRIAPDRPEPRRQALADARAAAFAGAVHAGADPDRVEIVEVEETPLAYPLQPVVMIHVKAAGPWG